nr:accessory gland protein Acp29AB-like [Drosophila takahashii]
MFYSATYLLCSFALLALQGSWAATQEKGHSVCLLNDPPNQCGPFCLSKLDPMRGKLVSIERRQYFMQSKILAVKSRLEDQGLRMEKQLLAMQSELSNQLQALQSDIQIKLDSILQTVQVLQESVKSVITMEDFQSRVNETEEKIPPVFEQIGSRFFHFEHNLEQNWTTAADSCRKLGGYLAAIRDEEEFNAIKGKLKNERYYWLGINDLKKDGEYVSVASGRPATFLKWAPDQPNHLERKQNCIIITNNEEMWDFYCRYQMQFICQSDSEV